MRQLFLVALIYGWFATLLCLPLHAEDPAKQSSPKPEAAKAPDNARPAAAEVPAKPEFLFHIVDSRGTPVARAKVTALDCSFNDGRNVSAKLDADDVAPAITDTDGLARLVFESDPNHPPRPALQRLLTYGINRLGLKVEHPDHPICLRPSVDPLGNTVITLADSNQVEIRAHRANETLAAHHLYPVISATSSDWSEAPDGMVTIRRVDLSSDRSSRWLRIVQVADNGPAWFSEAIDLLPKNRGLISIDVELKRGVRVEGLLDVQVPRPLKNGRVVALIPQGASRAGPSFWEAAADVAPDGSFIMESLPNDEYLQLTASCDGWVSTNPTDEELAYYAKHFDDRGADPRAASERRVCAQVFPLRGEKIEPAISMQRSATCEVTVLDQNESPLPGARVDFSYPVSWFYGIQSINIGSVIDRLSIIRNELRMGAPTDVGKLRTEQRNASTARYQRIHRCTRNCCRTEFACRH